LAFEKRASEIRDKQAAAKKPVVVPPPPPPPPPPPAVRSAEAKAYDARWENAMARATARGYARAAADLEKHLATVKEDALKTEAAQDLADLKELGRVYQSTITAAAVARSIDLKTVEGRVLSADADRVEVFLEAKKPTVFVEWMDARAEAL